MLSFFSILEGNGFPIKKATRELESLMKLSKEERDVWRQKQRTKIVEYHKAHSPLYRKLLLRKATDSWEDLPIVKKSDLQQPISEMLSDEYASRQVYISNTSGSSGHPFFFAKDKFAHALTWAYIRKQYDRIGIHEKDLQARFYGIPLSGASFAKEKLKDWLMNRSRFPVFDLGDDQLENFLGRFAKRKFHYIYGYTNSILLFCQFLLRQGKCLKDVCPSLKCCIVTSEVCTEADKLMIQSATGVSVIREYGASELDIIALEDSTGRWTINEFNLWVEVIGEDNERLPPGSPGRLVITSLHNKAMPFIRYEIGDVGILNEDLEGTTLTELSGRINDTILLPSGKKSPGLTFYYVSRSILESGGVLKEFIIRQTLLDTFEFDIVSDRPLNATEEKSIQLKMDEYLEPGLKLKIKRVERIQRPANGKTKHFYSEILK